MKKTNWKNIAVISFIMGVGLLTIYLLSRGLFIGLSRFAFIAGNLFSILGWISLYKFITFGKTYKWYRVINDTKNSHGMVNEFVRFAWNGDKETIIAKDTKTGKLIKFDVKDLKEATAEYITIKLEQGVLFFAGLTALVILAANVINEGHWFGSVSFAIISFVCFTVYKLQKDEY
jgi:hypothetical protein